MKTIDGSSVASTLLVFFGVMTAVAQMLYGDTVNSFLLNATSRGVILIENFPRYLQSLLG